MTSSPKVNGGGEEGGFGSPRLTLHIPNSYPRNFSPRGSPKKGSPSAQSVNIPIEADSPKKDDSLLVPPSNNRLASSTSAPGDLAGTSDGALLPAFTDNDTHIDNHKSTWTSLKAFFKVGQTTAESARDFLARERTFFSWLRLSSMLAIGSAALFLRLQLRDLSQVIGHGGHHNIYVGKGMYTAGEGSAIIQALRMQAMRKNALRQQSVMVSPTYVAKIVQSPSIPDSDSERNLLDTSVALSEALGILFFALAIFSLVIGYIDYMRCVRALEHADEVVPVMANPAANNTDDNHPNNLERRAVAQRYHDARHARQAHSTKVVYITEVIVAFVIFATALTILLTNHEASIAPPSPNR